MLHIRNTKYYPILDSTLGVPLCRAGFDNITRLNPSRLHQPKEKDQPGNHKPLRGCWTQFEMGLLPCAEDSSAATCPKCIEMAAQVVETIIELADA